MPAIPAEGHAQFNTLILFDEALLGGNDDNTPQELLLADNGDTALSPTF